ncbi:hypothetical protein MSG28_000321 [Choristoneura fumiferana]|uniref:Uncharacterized protein n=1 Tax=Choristoneura fumiferana TaxID=7141 RepID=A0ACC0K0G9_CHOFU|nr:hypothetical protein MSG28_000321 [Choristoneura fumiferana]
MEDLKVSLTQYNEQLLMVNTALLEAKDDEKESLLALQSDLHQLIQLTQESLDALISKDTAATLSHANNKKHQQNEGKTELDDEYALFMRYQQTLLQDQELGTEGAHQRGTTASLSCQHCEIVTRQVLLSSSDCEARGVAISEWTVRRRIKKPTLTQKDLQWGPGCCRNTKQYDLNLLKFM